MKDVCISAYWLTPTGRGFRIPENCTDERGNFRIEELQPGKYRLEITPNKRNPNKKSSKTFFYPGVSDKELAEPIVVDAGLSADGLTIRLMN